MKQSKHSDDTSWTGIDIMHDGFSGRVIMVTGAGGSIGAALCEKLLRYRPKQLILFELSEAALFPVLQNLRPQADWHGTEITPVLGSVTDSGLVTALFTERQIDVVLHAAAYKHVSLVEANPLIAITNNVIGTAKLAEAAVKGGASRFTLVSSDKAVNPKSVMGATKRAAEHIVQLFDRHSAQTAFGITRFGNVIGSSGSIVPVFQNQIRAGGPVTLTDHRMMRYFLTLDDAVDCVLHTNLHARNGDVFVPDMGHPIPIRHIAKRLIQSAGKTLRGRNTANGGITIKYIGRQSGEKLKEELTYSKRCLPTSHPRIFQACEPRLRQDLASDMLKDLIGATETHDAKAALDTLLQYVEGFEPSSLHLRSAPIDGVLRSSA